MQLKTPLETLIPLETRRMAWEALRAAGPYRIATLDYPWAVRPIGLILAAAMALVEQFRIWQIPGAIWLWPILGLFGIWMFAEKFGKMMWILAAWRLRLEKPYTLSSKATNMANGVYMFLSLDNDNKGADWKSNPWMVQFPAVWTPAAGTGSPGARSRFDAKAGV